METLFNKVGKAHSACHYSNQNWTAHSSLGKDTGSSEYLFPQQTSETLLGI